MKYSISVGAKCPRIVRQMKVFIQILLLGFCTFSVSYAQENSVGGHITDTQNEPLIGVTIQVKGTTTGTVTDMNGDYSIKAGNSSVLVFSYVGYVTREINVGNQQVIHVKLQEDSQALDEVVVIGYGSLKRKEVTSAVETIKADQFNKGATRDVMDLVQGKIAGLNMTRTNANDPNAELSIQLRGVSSIKGDRSPLIVIDGIPISTGDSRGYLSMLQPDDIESFNVLKDGSAAAIYGTRANAGVILIETKKGKAGSAQFDYSGYLSHDITSKKPNYLNAAQFREQIKAGNIAASQDLGGDGDLWDALTNKNNISHYHNLSLSGGSQNTNYRASAYFAENQGIAKEHGNQRWGGRININQKGFQDRLTASLNLATQMRKQNNLGGGTTNWEQAVQRNPTAPLYNEDGSAYQTQGFNNYNPLDRLANRIDERNQQSTQADIKMKLEIIEGLSISAFGAHMRDTYNNRLYLNGADWDNRGDRQGMGYAKKENALDWSNQFESTIDFRRIFKDKHTVTALVGYSYQYSTRETFHVDNSGFSTDGFKDWNLGAGLGQDRSSGNTLPRVGLESNKQDNTLVAIFGRVNYSYMDKYFIQAVLRHEGSSRFGVNHKWGNFPAISAGWSIGDETFMQGITFLDDLKLRLGYGVTGNQGIPNYQSIVTLGTGGQYPQGSSYYQTYGPEKNPNPDLRWEEKAELNFGVDFGILNHRITGSLDLYTRDTRDLLYDYVAQKPSYIQDRVWTNVGTIRSRGVELQLSALALETKDFSWNVDFAFAYNDNKLTKLSDDAFKADYLEFYNITPSNLGQAFRLKEGGKMGDFYGKRFAGFTDDGKWLFYKSNGEVARVTEINNNDYSIIGNGMPKIQATLGSTFRYKQFDLSFMFRGKFGFDILNELDIYYGNKKWLPNNILESAITKHTELNDDPQYSDYYLEKGDFVKLDNVTLGYTFKFKTPYIRNLRIYATGKNLLTITGYSGFDPEISDSGFDPGVQKKDFYPRTTTLTFGVNIGF